MKVDVVLLPAHARRGRFSDHGVAVFDVLRATTTITYALNAGVREIRLFDSIDAVRVAAQSCETRRLLCGEEKCLPPSGFDLGNSPGQFTDAHRGATLLMCTTNGTRALLAAGDADLLVPAAIVNASAVARVLHGHGRDVVLLCAGTNGEVAEEDILGAGAVIDELLKLGAAETTAEAGKAHAFFDENRVTLLERLRSTQGGRNVIAAGLDADIDAAAKLNSLEVVGVARGEPLLVTRLQPD